MARRKHLLQLILGASALVGMGAMAACSGGPAADAPEGDAPEATSFEGETLNVTAYAGAWGDAFTEAFVEPFEAETGAKVNVIPGTTAEWLTKLRASQNSAAPFDVVLFTADLVPNAIASNLVSELDASRIGDFAQINEVLLQQSAQGDAQYGLPLSVGPSGLAYRSDRVTEPVEDWSDIFRDDVCGQVAVPPLTINVGIELLAGLAAEQGGDIANPDDLDRVFDLLEENKDCVSAFPADGASIGVALEQGDAVIAPWWDGRTFSLKNTGAPVDFVYPEAGAVGALSSFFITENTERQDLAYEFLNTLADADNQKVFSEQTWYSGSNDTVENSETFTEQIKNGTEVYESWVWIDYSVIGPQITELQDRWSRIFS